VLVADTDQRGKQITGRLLAHAAIAEVRIVPEFGGVEADRAALAAAGHLDHLLTSGTAIPATA